MEESQAGAVSADRPPIDPYPLSPYVAWAGNRNRDPILQVFREIFPEKSGHVLELASGAGNHINYFAPHFPDLQFQPSDYDTDVFDTIKQKRAEQGNANVTDPVKIDLTAPETWPDPKERLYDVIFVVNLFQVAPVSIAEGGFLAGREAVRRFLPRQRGNAPFYRRHRLAARPPALPCLRLRQSGAAGRGARPGAGIWTAGNPCRPYHHRRRHRGRIRRRQIPGLCSRQGREWLACRRCDRRRLFGHCIVSGRAPGRMSSTCGHLRSHFKGGAGAARSQERDPFSDHALKSLISHDLFENRWPLSRIMIRAVLPSLLT